MKCVNHPDTDAIALCVSCGVGLCADCRKVVRGATFCADCAATHQPMRINPGASGGTNVWAVFAWVLAVVGWYPPLLFLEVAGVILGFVALGDISLSGGRQSGRGYAIGAIVCAGIGLIANIAVVAYMLANGLELSPWLNPLKYMGELFTKNGG